jgi:hypothetical protein
VGREYIYIGGEEGLREGKEKKMKGKEEWKGRYRGLRSKAREGYQSLRTKIMRMHGPNGPTSKLCLCH